MTEHGSATFPRWREPGAPPGNRGWRLRLPATLTAALDSTAEAAGVPSEAVLMAAHLKVFRTVKGDRDVLIRCRAGTGGWQQCRVTVPDGTWRDLMALASESLRAAPADGPAADVAVDLAGVADPGAGRAAPPGGTSPVLSLTWTREGDRLVADGEHRGEQLDDAYVERFRHHLVRALTLLTERPGASHDACSLLSPEEELAQLELLTGPVVPMPGRSFVQLFQEQVQRRPDDLAAAHGDRRWTYAELNDRANRVCRELRAGGLDTAGVVGVVMERNLEWVAAILGILKAGGVYLPMRPEFPAERISRQLRRSDCRVVLTEPASTHRVTPALAACGPLTPRVVQVPDACAAGGPAPDPDGAVRDDQVAYIYFTSGSTGEPKGAMIEHAGMVNHLYAKVTDLELTAGDTVAQIAPQCFDISFWQLFAPLLVGGSTRIVDTEVLLDAGAFLDELTAHDVRVVQVVPSYLDVLLAHVERAPRELPRLRSVSVTGEALKYDLVRRWFAHYPAIPLVNAYGATEVSDDTMHAVLRGVPERPFVPVGHLLQNVHVYLLDDRLRMVPLGSPGEIVFSGVSVGRGYVNDEERTAKAFVPDPYRPGTRMYRTGDYGRWLPEGTIEYLGRADQQVKIRGFRIEIGEIENRLLAADGVRDAAVVVAGTSQRDRRLVAFCVAEPGVETERLRAGLAEAVPDYMVPAAFHLLPRLPLTENGKVDKLALGKRVDEAARVGESGATGHAAPSTAAERQLAAAWADVLQLPMDRIGRDDDFFALGGTSLAAVRLLVRLDGAVSLGQMTGQPTLRGLAALIDPAGQET
ncbi:hypothetical protein ACTI_45250 [Actinoplanes sp. OR16]|uniref:non-ribosomal peptide synthetase n=1 Tax=Actinoplanes sp. OR16 TaxID=946334 RepID=UPI000F6BA456|nr:non-ribosomal peptide synthetase [Actinoplanes sp. OR16]BBH67840.1 hypothetical protein ACTI_45250 [Actinoplanes sp. OR16]